MTLKLSINGILVSSSLKLCSQLTRGGEGGGGGEGGFNWVNFCCRYVPLASQSPYLVIVYSVANYRPYLSHFWASM